MRTRKDGSIQAEVIQAIRRAIFSGDLQPGDPVPEMHWARRHNVSQTTIREALGRLEHAGLVRRFRNKGTFVTSLSPQELSEHLRLRIMLESMAGVDAARRVTQKNLRELKIRLRAIEAAVGKNDYFQSAQADMEFHRCIWRQSGDRTLYRILDQLTVPLFAFTSMRRSGSHEELKRVVRSHEPIIAALKEGDRDVIRQALRAHIEGSYMQFLDRGAMAPHETSAGLG